MVTVVIPAYNEEKSIGNTIKRCLEILRNSDVQDIEIMVVDDGSSDQTTAIAIAENATVVKHPHNIGYGKALKNGILKAKYDTIIITDADGTYPIDKIQDLLEEYKNGFDMVVGARTGTHYHESFWKSINRRILKFLVEFTAGRNIPDINSGLRIFSKRTILPYFDTLCDTFSFTTSLTLAYMMTGKFVAYIPISYNKRIGNTKVHMFRDSLRTMQFIVEAILFYNPIKIYLFIALLLIIMALVALGIALFTKILIFYITGIIGLFFTLLTIVLGLISIQLKQIITRNASK